MKRVYGVTIPIAGHLFIEVEAEDEEAAIDTAIDQATLDHLETWESLRQFNQGNVCYCPQPWEAEAEDYGPVDDAQGMEAGTAETPQAVPCEAREPDGEADAPGLLVDAPDSSGVASELTRGQG